MLKEELRQIAKLQRSQLELQDAGIERELGGKIDLNIHHVIILSGIRRCGKSTLMKQMTKRVRHFFYLCFEDQKLLNFEVEDFDKLDEIFNEEFGKSNYYFFDEIQNVAGWERFVRKMQDKGKKFVLTGSNASLLSRELGTKLTGRHLRYELFPFSYKEQLKLLGQKPSLTSFENYIKTGGFPEFIKYNDTNILQELLNDIVVRDIISRYNLRDQKLVKEIAIYLITNAGKEFSYNKLAKNFNLGSVNTARYYISYFEDSYLLFTISRFNYSYKKQIINPKKVYSIDLGLSSAISVSFSSDKGRLLENVVFLHLRRKYNEIYYFRDEKECDFIVKERGVLKAIQVCLEINEDNKERELEGLKEAMKKLKIKDALIITLNQDDNLNGIQLISVWKWMLES